MTLNSINDQKRERNTFFNLQIGKNCDKRPVKVDINQQNRFAVHLNSFMDTNMLLIEIKINELQEVLLMQTIFAISQMILFILNREKRCSLKKWNFKYFDASYTSCKQKAFRPLTKGSFFILL